MILPSGLSDVDTSADIYAAGSTIDAQLMADYQALLESGRGKWDVGSPSTPAPIGSAFNLSGWLKQNEKAVYIGSAALVGMFLLKGRRR